MSFIDFNFNKEEQEEIDDWDKMDHTEFPKNPDVVGNILKDMEIPPTNGGKLKTDNIKYHKKKKYFKKKYFKK